MSTQAAETTVRDSIVVDAPIERAFRVFTEDFGAFKPPSHNLLAVEISYLISDLISIYRTKQLLLEESVVAFLAAGRKAK